MKVGIAYSLAPSATDQPLDGPDDRFEEFDKPETVEAIAAVIRGEGHEVILLGDGREFLTRVLADRPDFVFNIAEGEGVGRCREARVPAVLEMLGIPYSGSDPLTLAASLDKDVAKKLVGLSAETTPPFCARLELPISQLLPTSEAHGLGWLEYLYSPDGPFHRDEFLRNSPPSILFKPAFEGSSKGIRAQCIANTLDEAISLYRELLRTYGQPILAEEFINGDEVTVGVLGKHNQGRGEPMRILGIMRIIPKVAQEGFVYSLEVKRDWANRVTYETPARYPDALRESIEDATIRIYNALGCRDCARIDFRVRDGIPYFIEANPLPGLAPVSSDLVILAAGYGISHAELIRKILNTALVRVGLA